MIRTSFNDSWQVRPKVSHFAEISGATAPFRPVALPHDAMIGQRRSASGNAACAYFPSGVFEYRKIFFVPEQDRGKRVLVEFEGVYRDAVVSVNGAYAGQRPYGYSAFRVDAGRFLRAGRDNEIRVEARSHADSRWYTGSGIYRDTWLLTGGPVRIGPDGVRVMTPDTDAERAVVAVAVLVENDSGVLSTVNVVIEIRDAAGTVVAGAACPVTVLPGEPATARQRLYVRDPSLWGPDSPALYTCAVTLTDPDGGPADAETVTFGIRSLRLDPEHGLRVNGETVKLRGACVHHDNGVLGAATFARAEERRVQLLKEAGFNAIRMSHHPMSSAMLNACDRLGMFVLDEAFDMWAAGKSEFDYGLSFPDWWERDIEAMVAKDYNHPSVILYSTGNEIPEIGSPAGDARGRELAEKIRSLDGTRYVTNAVNNMLAVLPDLAAQRQGEEEAGGLNALMADIAGAMNAIAASDLATRRTAESYSVLDVAGMNYSDSRYEPDRELFPGRIILGTETFPTRIDGNWRLVSHHSHVIGDFTWTGWDYLGEVGIGRPQYGSRDPSFTAPYPYLLAGCGDLDVTGFRRPASYYRETVFGLRRQPYIAVERPEHHGQTFAGTPWSWPDCLSSWTWPGWEGKAVTVEVYSDADEVELLLNGRSLGRHPAGEKEGFRAGFETRYEPGELTAVAFRDGTETGRGSIRTATGPVLLHARAERTVITAAGGDLAYVTLTLEDAHGTLCTGDDRPVTVTISGDGVLAGFGSANPSTEEPFSATTRRTYEGRALAVLRPAGPGMMRLLASCPGCDPAETVIAIE